MGRREGLVPFGTESVFYSPWEHNGCLRLIGGPLAEDHGGGEVVTIPDVKVVSVPLALILWKDRGIEAGVSHVYLLEDLQMRPLVLTYRWWGPEKEWWRKKCPLQSD